KLPVREWGCADRKAILPPSASPPAPWDKLSSRFAVLRKPYVKTSRCRSLALDDRAPAGIQAAARDSGTRRRNHLQRSRHLRALPIPSMQTGGPPSESLRLGIGVRESRTPTSPSTGVLPDRDHPHRREPRSSVPRRHEALPSSPGSTDPPPPRYRP